MVATQGADGMKLYVDGAVVATNRQTQAQDYTGYWRVGGDQAWGPNDSQYFAGSIDEAAVYSSVLSSDDVESHYVAGGGTAANQSPVAAFTSSSTALAASFDGSGSSDPDGTVASYAWNYGDNTAAGSGVSSSHTYGAAGTYTVTLTVTDNKGATDAVQHDVTVTAANQSPVAAFTSSSTALAASFDGSGSSDPDGTVASYAWNYGDNTAAGSGVSSSHTYGAAGTYTVTLTVTDNKGATDAVQHDVTVTAANQSPVAAFTSSSTALAASFDGSGSSDPDGTVASYAWNYGDNTAAGSGVSSSHTYGAAGTYTVTLTVTDNKGATDAVQHDVTVTAANQSPVAAFTSSSTALAASFDGSGSSDPDGTVASYAWNYGDNTAAGSGVSSSHTYGAAGTYTVTLTVTDNKGATDAVQHDVTVTAAQAAQIAADGYGRTVVSGWGTADTGGPWTIVGTKGNFAVNGGTGSMTMTAAGQGPAAYLNGVSTSDSDTQVTVTTTNQTTGGGVFESVIGRQITGVGSYRAVVNIGPMARCRCPWSASTRQVRPISFPPQSCPG